MQMLGDRPQSHLPALDWGSEMGRRTAEVTRQRHGAHTQASFLRGAADSSVIGSLIKAPRNLGHQLLWVVKSIMTLRDVLPLGHQIGA